MRGRRGARRINFTLLFRAVRCIMGIIRKYLKYLEGYYDEINKRSNVITLAGMRRPGMAGACIERMESDMFKRLTALMLVAALALSLGAGALADGISGITYNPLLKTLSVTGMNLEYSTDNVSWTRFSGTIPANKPIGATGDTTTFYIRTVGTTSVDTEVTIRHFDDNLTYNNTSQLISGFTTNFSDGETKEYRYSTAPSATSGPWTEMEPGADTLSATPTSADQKYHFQYITKTIPDVVSGKYFYEFSEIITLTVPKKGASDISNIMIDFTANPEKFALKDTTKGDSLANYVYTTQSATYIGKFSSYMEAGNHVVNGVTYDVKNQVYPDTKYYIRRDNDSVGKEFTTPKRPAAPTGLYYDATNQAIMFDKSAAIASGTSVRYDLAASGPIGWVNPDVSVTSGMKATTDPVPGIPIAQTPSDQSYVVALAATDKSFASFNATVRVWGSLGAGFETLRLDNGLIKGIIDDKYEYGILECTPIKNASNEITGWNDPDPASISSLTWTPLTATAALDKSSDGLGQWAVPRISSQQFMYIRYKDDTPSLTPPKKITIPSKEGLPDEIEIDYLNDRAVGFNTSSESNGYLYSTNYKAGSPGAATWIDVKTNSHETNDPDPTRPTDGSEGWFDLSNFMKGKKVTLYFARKSPEYPSIRPEADNVLEVVIDAGPAKPALKSAGYATVKEDSELSYWIIAGKAAEKGKVQYKNILNKWETAPVATPGSIANAIPAGYDVLYAIPARYTAIAYQFRIAPVATETVAGNEVKGTQGSEPIKTSAAAMPAAPKIKADYKKEIVTIKPGQSYNLTDPSDSGAWVDVTKSAGKTEISLREEGKELYGGYIWVRTTAGSKPASYVTELKILPRPEDKNGLITEVKPELKDISILRKNGKEKLVMTPGSRQIEFRAGTTGKWKKGLPKITAVTGDIWVRFAATAVTGPSEERSLMEIMPETFNREDSAALDPLEIDLDRSVIYGLDADPLSQYMYKVEPLTAGAASPTSAKPGKWKAIPAKYINVMKIDGTVRTVFDISFLLKNKAIAVSVAKKEGDTMADDAGTRFEVKAAGFAKPKVVVSSYVEASPTSLCPFNVKIATPTGFTASASSLQYKLETDDVWQNVPDGNILEGGYTAISYQFRIKPNDDGAQGSPIGKMKVAAPPKPPAVTVDYKNEQIKLKAGLQYSLDGETWPVENKGLTTQMIDLKNGDLYGEELYVSTLLTSKKPPSLINTVRINARIDDPPNRGVVWAENDKFVSQPGARPMETWDPSSRSWKKGLPPWSTAIETAAGTANPYKVRYAANGVNAASEGATLTSLGAPEST